MARSQDIVLFWSNMSTCGLLYQVVATTNSIQRDCVILFLTLTGNEVSYVFVMNWLTVTECLRQNLPWICSVCPYHNSFLSPLIPYHQFFNKSNMTTPLVSSRKSKPFRSTQVYPPLPVFSGVCVAQSYIFYVVFCRRLLVFLFFFFWPYLLCVPTTSD
jgi:hypothetical protein